MQGKLSAIKPGVLIRLQGNPLITGTRYSIEKLRCNLCGDQYNASVPDEIENSEKYAPSCKTSLVISRYHMGLPFKRIESWQSFQKIPVPDATQWDKVEELYQVLRPVHQALEVVASEGVLFCYDDTLNKILTHKAHTAQGETQRKGVYTTAIISQTQSHDIHLFYTGGCYAGENIDELLSKRSNEAPFLTMTDASQNNFPRAIDDTLLARWIICFCLVHGRRKFYQIKDFFDKECAFVLEQFATIYQHEADSKAQQLTPEQRLAYHQQHSAPIMEELQIWLNNQLIYEQIEPSSGLFQAIRYMLRHWQALTQFLRTVGAPLDNNRAERAIKFAIRHRRNSLFYKTNHGAEVGDCMMSLILTAINNGVNAFDYFNTLQCYPEQVAAQPAKWLPWNYQTTLAQMKCSSTMAA